MSFFSMMSDFLSAGLTPDDKGEFKVVSTEMEGVQTSNRKNLKTNH